MFGLCQHNCQIQLHRVTSVLGGSITCALMAAGWWYGLILPIQATIHQSQIDQQAARQLQSERPAIVQRLAEVRSEASYWQAANNARLERVSPTLDDASFLGWLHQQADNCGLTVHDFRPQSKIMDSGYVSCGIAISAHGSYTAVCQFLDCLRSCPRMNRLTTIDLVPRNPEGTHFNLNLHGLLFTQSSASTSSGAGA
ncbi:MAG: type 4a pilus biogenesis protein PilO [Pirellulaceae bacterium]|nr:type 4a pilus biogenesis protein PilO [Pirellulaceae bacterium]